MKYKEVQKDLFKVNLEKYAPVHCIASDCRMGAGIAVPMKQRFLLKDLISFSKEQRKHPTCIYYNGVYNLITKEFSNDKPTLENLVTSLELMKNHVDEYGFKYLVMPKIGCGLDGLNWKEVSFKLQQLFMLTDVEILVCYL